MITGVNTDVGRPERSGSSPLDKMWTWLDQGKNLGMGLYNLSESIESAKTADVNKAITEANAAKTAKDLQAAGSEIPEALIPYLPKPMGGNR